jgi:hypothetical protein
MFNVVYDTGSDWLVLKSKDCLTSNYKGFDSRKSTSFSKLALPAEEMVYGSASTKGNYVTD